MQAITWFVSSDVCRRFTPGTITISERRKSQTTEVRSMAHVHDAHHGHSSTTVVDRDTEGPATLLIVIVVLAALALLIWFFAFSGVVFDRGGDSGPNTNIEQQIDN